MKIEAIRTDRSRGGRSSYDGAHRSVSTSRSVSARPSSYHLSRLSEGAEHRRLLEQLLEHDTTLMPEEEEECCRNLLLPNDTEPLQSIMHIADHCLYKIVRWARNLPNFSNISTEDQVILIQNSWLELLLLNAAWRNVQSPNRQLYVGNKKCLTTKQAVDLGVNTLVQRLLVLRDQLKKLNVDKMEFCALKTLTLLSPDVTAPTKSLSNTEGVAEYRMKLAIALRHHCRQQSKYLQLLTRTADNARLSADVRQVLVGHFNRNSVPTTLLLHELLKEDEAAVGSLKVEEVGK